VTIASSLSGEQIVNGRAVKTQADRTWRSPVADIDFRDAGNGQVEPATIHGIGGVTVTSSIERGDATPLPSKFVADQVTAVFGPDSTLQTITGVGHATMEQTAANGAWQSASGDRIDARIAPAADTSGQKQAATRGGGSSLDVESATLDGDVVLLQKPAQKPGAQPPPELDATAGHATYESAGQWLHLTMNPHVTDGAVELAAQKIDVTQSTGDAIATGGVKATWTNLRNSEGTASQGAVALGGKDPAHVIADQAHLRQATGEVEFDGNARLWQDANSIESPMILLDRNKRSLVARTESARSPVKVVLLSAANPGAAKERSSARERGRPSGPTVIRVQGGDLVYADTDRRAVMRGGPLGHVTAETGTTDTNSDRVELQLAPSEAHSAGQSQVESLTAIGHVVITSQGRRGTGEKLVYTSASGNYVLTGTSAAAPRISDPERGTATGEALIFNSRDDSVSIEGGTQQTETQTTAPKLRMGTEPENNKSTQRAAQPRRQQGGGSEPEK